MMQVNHHDRNATSAVLLEKNFNMLIWIAVWVYFQIITYISLRKTLLQSMGKRNMKTKRFIWVLESTVTSLVQAGDFITFIYRLWE